MGGGYTAIMNIDTWSMLRCGVGSVTGRSGTCAWEELDSNRSCGGRDAWHGCAG